MRTTSCSITSIIMLQYHARVTRVLRACCGPACVMQGVPLSCPVKAWTVSPLACCPARDPCI